MVKHHTPKGPQVVRRKEVSGLWYKNQVDTGYFTLFWHGETVNDT